MISLKIKKFIIIIYLLVLIFVLCGCGDNNNNKDIDKKIQSEIEYLDKQLIGVLNKLNNITLENYDVQIKETTSQEQSGQGKEKSSGENNSTSENGSSKSESSGESSSGGDSSGGTSKSNIKVLQMQPSNILVIDKDDVDWTTIKSEMEVMYSSWNSILLDLYNINIPDSDILAFGQALDNAILLVKSEDKQASLQAVANLYSYLPKYVGNLSIEESKKNILLTKSYILNAYALVEQENWVEVQNQINRADDTYSKVINDVNYIQSKQEEVGRVYVLIKELKNSINTQDKDIFYIKYKNLMNAIQ